MEEMHDVVDAAEIELRCVEETTLLSNLPVSQPRGTSSSNHSYVVNILDLPVELLEKIFSYISYEQIGKLRRTCTRFNDVGSVLLNSAFQRLQTVMQQRFQQIKSQMPRRESARRNHPLARECDIVETVHMRLTLLQMSFGKHVERKHCCFFAGEILDEVHRIFRHIKATPNLGRAYKVTDELFDLTTMAMEYFKEYIEPDLPEITYFATDFLDYSSFSSQSVKSCTWKSSGPSGSPCNASSPGPSDESQDISSNSVINKKIKRLRQGMKRNNSRVIFLKRELKSNKNQMADQQKQLIEYGTRLEDNDKKFEEYSRKFSALLQELNKCKTELQYWRSKSPANQICCLCQAAVAETKEDEVKAAPSIAGASSGNEFLPETVDALLPEVDSFEFVPISMKEEACNSQLTATAGRPPPLDLPCQFRCSYIKAAELHVTPDHEDGLQCCKDGDASGGLPPLVTVPLKRKSAARGRFLTDGDEEVPPTKRGKSVVKCLSYK